MRVQRLGRDRNEQLLETLDLVVQARIEPGLLRLGVFRSDAVAPGTPPLDAAMADRFDASFEALRADVSRILPARWVSDPAEAEER